MVKDTPIYLKTTEFMWPSGCRMVLEMTEPEAVMSPRTVFLCRLYGLFLVVLGAALACHRDASVATITEFCGDAKLLLFFGMVGLAAGLAMVLSHNLWSGGAPTVVVTAFGWLMLVKSLLTLLLPVPAVTTLYAQVGFAGYFYAYIGGYLVLGAWLTYAGFARNR